MANSISLEYLQAISGTASGLATLGADGKVTPTQLPDIVDTFKGTFADETALTAAYATATTGNYAYVTATSSYWYWNAALTAPAWVNQEIAISDYNALSEAEKAGAPYIIVPDPVA